jgi:hypothetical protein
MKTRSIDCITCPNDVSKWNEWLYNLVGLDRAADIAKTQAPLHQQTLGTIDNLVSK